MRAYCYAELDVSYLAIAERRVHQYSLRLLTADG